MRHPKSSLTAKLRKLLRILEVDRAVFFGLAAKSWGLGAGPVTAILIATNFTPELQGYYFTFASIVSLQVFVELGLGTVIVQFAAHEWAKLQLTESGVIIGDEHALSRLSSIAKIASRWYLSGAAVIAVGLGLAGYLFFSTTPDVGVRWVAPWLLLCFVTGISICLVPVWSLLEGCNQVPQVYTFRFLQGVASTTAVWLAILFGAGLWTASISGVVVLLCSVIFLRQKYWMFFKSLFFSNRIGPLMSWRKDLLPMQWRIGLATISWFFVYSFFVPVTFKFYGPVVAGQMGLTIHIMMAIGNLAFSWFTPKIPRFGVLIAKRSYRELDKLFFHNLGITLAILVATSATFCIGVYVLNVNEISIADRLLPPLAAGIFMLANLVGFASAPFSHYMRAHKEEPIVSVTVSGAVLIALSTFISGKVFGIHTMAISYLIINVGMTIAIVLIWHLNRRKWQTVPSLPAARTV